MKSCKYIMIYAALILSYEPIFSQLAPSISISAGELFTTGKAQYPVNIMEPSIFRGFQSSPVVSLDLGIMEFRHFLIGARTDYCSFISNNPNIVNSNRYINSKLSTYELGLFMSTPYIHSVFNSNLRFIISPGIAYLNVSNSRGNSTYYVNYTNVMPNTPGLVKSESVKQIKQLLPVLELSLEESVYFSEKYLLFIRPSISYMQASPGAAYPDKYLLAYSIKFGFSIDNKRDKWYFLKQKQ